MISHPEMISSGVATKSRRRGDLDSDGQASGSPCNQIEQMHSKIRTVGIVMESGAENIKMLILVTNSKFKAAPNRYKNSGCFALFSTRTREGRHS